MNSRDEDSEEASVTAHNMAENGCAAESSLKPQSGLNLQAAEDRRSRAKSKWKRLWRMSLLVLIMAVVDLLLAIPIAVYYVDFDGVCVYVMSECVHRYFAWRVWACI